jgi:hypothetical protein
MNGKLKARVSQVEMLKMQGYSRNVREEIFKWYDD